MNVNVRGDEVKENYDDSAKIIKALSDPSRLKIIDLLSCGKKCACDIQIGRAHV